MTKDVFKNVAAKSKEEGAKLSWSLNYDMIDYLIENDYTISVKYVEAIYVDKVSKEIKDLAKEIWC